MYEELKTALQDCEFFTLKNDVIRELSEKEKIKFEKTLKCLERATKYKTKPKIITFRGIGESYLSSRLGEYDKTYKLAMCFAIGDKGQHFYQSDRDESRKLVLTSIQDCSEETLIFIFNEIKELVKTNRGNEGINSSIKDFLEKNEVFTSFFEDNEPHSFSKYAGTELEEKIRDYYLYFLHTEGHCIKKESYFVSTSTKYHKALGYAQGGYVIVYIVPSPLDKFAVTHSTRLSYETKLKKKGLPLYNQLAIYDEESEIAIKGGLFQTQILGIKDIQKNKFIVNPYIFKMNVTACSIVFNKLEFDWADFIKAIQESNYHSSVIKWGDIYLSVSNDRIRVKNSHDSTKTTV